MWALNGRAFGFAGMFVPVAASGILLFWRGGERETSTGGMRVLYSGTGRIIGPQP